MGYYKLFREKQGPSEQHPNDPQNAVRGILYEVTDATRGQETLSRVATTLENADYIIPALIYKLQVNLSPRFGTLMPMLLQVPGRVGIRIHGGTKPSHSKGCVLVTARKAYQSFVKKLLEEQRKNEPMYIEICNP